MYKRRRKIEKEDATFIDRVAIAFFSGVATFFSGMLLWGLFVVFSHGEEFILGLFKYVVWFSVAMAFLGFLLLENIIIEILAFLWRGIGSFFGVIPKEKS